MMYKLLVAFIVIAFLGVAFAELHRPKLVEVPTEEEAAVLFANFKVDFNKSYATVEEEAQRFEYFKNSLKKIVNMNLKSKTATFGIFRFDDESPEEREFKRQNTVRFTEEQLAMQTLNKNITVDSIAINSYDWRNNNLITPVKDQGQCGDCWAFGATEMVEVANSQNGHGLQVLAPQQFLDCSSENGGCNGGNPATAVNQMIQQQGGALDYESWYNYVGYQQSQCGFRSQGTGAVVSQVSSVWNENDMYSRIQNGPLTVFVDDTTLYNYQSGYLDSQNCVANGVNHVTQLVGTGYWSDGTPVWIMKNSWGTGWADYGGYAYLAFGEGTCSVQTEGHWCQ